MKHLCEDNRSLSRDLNPGPSEYKAEVLTTRPRLSVPKRVRNTNIVLRVSWLRKQSRQ
jgi:hypothetical protein